MNILETMKQALDFIDHGSDNFRMEVITNLLDAISELEAAEPTRLQCVACGTIYQDGVPPTTHPAPAVPKGFDSIDFTDESRYTTERCSPEETKAINDTIHSQTVRFDDRKWQLVPKELTDEMYFAFSDKYGTDFDTAYKAMLAAAPTPGEVK